VAGLVPEEHAHGLGMGLKGAEGDPHGIMADDMKTQYRERIVLVGIDYSVNFMNYIHGLSSLCKG